MSADPICPQPKVAENESFPDSSINIWFKKPRVLCIGYMYIHLYIYIYIYDKDMVNICAFCVG